MRKSLEEIEKRLRDRSDDEKTTIKIVGAVAPVSQQSAGS